MTAPPTAQHPSTASPVQPTTYTGAADFEHLAIVPKPDPTIGRISRITNNSRNLSHSALRFGGSTHAYNNETERYDGAVAYHEKLRQEQKGVKQKGRYEFRRHWLADIEESRWKRMAAEDSKQQGVWERRHEKTRVGANSVSYNPITLDYLPTNAGDKLAAADAELLRRTAARAAVCYMRSNSYNPISGSDVVNVNVVLHSSDARPAASRPRQSAEQSNPKPEGPTYVPSVAAGQPSSGGLRVPRRLQFAAVSVSRDDITK